MKEIHVKVIMIIVIIGIILFSYHLTSTLPLEWCINITIIVNFIVGVYLILNKNRK